MADLSFNVDTLRGQAAQIARIKTDLASAKDDLSKHMQDLKNDWRSDAGEKFFENYNTDWVNHIDEYCAMLDELSQALYDAANRYEPLVQEYNRISLSV